jgi:hypothetical protein
LDGSGGHKDNVVTPHVPGRRVIRKTVFDHNADGCLDHWLGILQLLRDPGWKLRVETGSAWFAAVLRVNKANVLGDARCDIPDVMEDSLDESQPDSGVTAFGTGAILVVPLLLSNLGGGNIESASPVSASVRCVFGTAHLALL